MSDKTRIVFFVLEFLFFAAVVVVSAMSLIKSALS